MTFTERVAHHFRCHPNEWVSAYTLMDLGGKMAWRSRVSNCRTQLRMTIENRQKTLESGEVFSEYRWRPHVMPSQPMLFEAARRAGEAGR